MNQNLPYQFQNSENKYQQEQRFQIEMYNQIQKQKLLNQNNYLVQSVPSQFNFQKHENISPPKICNNQPINRTCQCSHRFPQNYPCCTNRQTIIEKQHLEQLSISQCVICNESYSLDQKLTPTQLPNCNHTFCENCLYKHEINQRADYIKSLSQNGPQFTPNLVIHFQCPICEQQVNCQDLSFYSMSNLEIDVSAVMNYSIVKQFQKNIQILQILEQQSLNQNYNNNFNQFQVNRFRLPQEQPFDNDDIKYMQASNQIPFRERQDNIHLQENFSSEKKLKKIFPSNLKFQDILQDSKSQQHQIKKDLQEQQQIINSADKAYQNKLYNYQPIEQNENQTYLIQSAPVKLSRPLIDQNLCSFQTAQKSIIISNDDEIFQSPEIQGNQMNKYDNTSSRTDYETPLKQQNPNYTYDNFQQKKLSFIDSENDVQSKCSSQFSKIHGKHEFDNENSKLFQNVNLVKNAFII